MPLDHTNTTALVTGASSGLGEEFARQLAARGANLILVARRVDRLEQLATELRASAGVTVTVLPADLARPGAANELAARIDELGIPVHTLINNAGFATRARFENEDADRIQDELAVNVAAVVGLTRAFYPQLLEHGKGALVSVASTAAYQPVPNMAVYGATKAFVLSFTEALWYEAKGTGLRVLALSPGATRTEFFDVAGSQAQVGSMRPASEVVKLALAALDRRSAPPSVLSGTVNRAIVLVSRLLPRRAVVNLTGRVTGRGMERRATPAKGVRS